MLNYFYHLSFALNFAKQYLKITRFLNIDKKKLVLFIKTIG